MNDTLKRLTKATRINASNKRFPGRYEDGDPSVITLKMHLEIYRLVKEYDEMAKDYEAATCQTTKELIKEHLDGIERELFKYWICPDNKMVIDEK